MRTDLQKKIYGPYLYDRLRTSGEKKMPYPPFPEILVRMVNFGEFSDFQLRFVYQLTLEAIYVVVSMGPALLTNSWLV